MLRRLLLIILGFVSTVSFLPAAARVFPLPAELQSEHFLLKIDGQPTPVAHAATTYYFANFDLQGSAQISITAPSDDYWSAGVEVQPWRWGIRPVRQGRTISFTISEPMKLSVSRPGNHGAGAEMLFLFANVPEPEALPHAEGIRYYGPGVYHENIDAHNGDRIYIAPGAVIFGAINVWGTRDVRISGRGTVVYDGPQDPAHDEGWKHQPNWHVVGMDNARNVEISGITLVVRSRTWMIQMLDSHDVRFINVKVIGGCPGNANQDGVDWLGGGDTLIRDCFFRASDDIFALYGNWLGYTPEALTTPGHDVENIHVEDSVLSTSISNVVRVSWPQKIFNSRNFEMRNSDVIHMGAGGCKIPFALLEIWDDPGGRGTHNDYKFENVRLEDWYSLIQLRQQNPEIRNISVKDVWPLETPALVPSVISGDVQGVRVRSEDDGQPSFSYSDGELRPGKVIAFHVDGTAAKDEKTYSWTFGDGTSASGPVVEHSFPDSNGTLLDGSGRFQVLLKATTVPGQTSWASRSVVISNAYQAPGTGSLDAKATGGYTFFLVGNDTAKLEIDGQTVAVSPDPKPQVCGSVGNMAQLAIGSIGLKAGKHSIRVAKTHTTGPDNFALYWQGPRTPLAQIPAAWLSH